MTVPSFGSDDDPLQAARPNTDVTAMAAMILFFNILRLLRSTFPTLRRYRAVALRDIGSSLNSFGNQLPLGLTVGGGFGLPFFCRSVVLVSFFGSLDDPEQDVNPKIETTATAAMVLGMNIRGLLRRNLHVTADYARPLRATTDSSPSTTSTLMVPSSPTPPSRMIRAARSAISR